MLPYWTGSSCALRVREMRRGPKKQSLYLRKGPEAAGSLRSWLGGVLLEDPTRGALHGEVGLGRVNYSCLWKQAWLESVQREIKGRENLQTASLDGSVREFCGCLGERASEWTREIYPRENLKVAAMNLKSSRPYCIFFFSSRLYRPESWRKVGLNLVSMKWEGQVRGFRNGLQNLE